MSRMWAGCAGLVGPIWKVWFAAMGTTVPGATLVVWRSWVRDVSEKATMTDGADVGGTLHGADVTHRTRVTVRLGEVNSVASMFLVRSVGAEPRNSSLSPKVRWGIST